MGKIKSFFQGIGKKLKGFPKGKQSKAFVRILQFFAIMIVLTIFARGVAGVTMPEVETTLLSQQTIRREENFSGTVTSSSSIDVKPLAGLTVLRVHVSIGANVETGDELVTFDTALMDEALLQQQGTLLQLRQELQTLQNSEGPDDSAVKAAEKALETAVKARDEAQNTVNNAAAAVNNAASAISTAQTAYNNAVASRINDINNIKSALKQAYDEAVADEVKAYDEFIAAKAAYDLITEDPSNEAWIKAKAEMDYKEGIYNAAVAATAAAKTNYENQASVAAAQVEANIAALQQNINDAQGSKTAADSALSAANTVLESANEAVADAQKALDEARADYEKAKGDAVLAEQIRQNSIRLKKLEIADQEKVVNDMVALQAAGGVLTATADGMVSDLTLKQGAVTVDTDYVRLSTTSGGYMVEFKVSQDKLRDITIGSAVNVKLANYYWGYEARITGRGLPDESGMVTMRAQLNTTEFKDGDAVQVTVVLSDRQYWNCVPVGAVRPDENGYYVLVLGEENTILGTQTVARKVAVTITDQNNEYAAVEFTASSDGYIDYNAKIILSSNKPVNDGDMVRLGEESTK